MEKDKWMKYGMTRLIEVQMDLFEIQTRGKNFHGTKQKEEDGIWDIFQGETYVGDDGKTYTTTHVGATVNVTNREGINLNIGKGDKTAGKGADMASGNLSNSEIRGKIAQKGNSPLAKAQRINLNKMLKEDDNALFDHMEGLATGHLSSGQMDGVNKRLVEHFKSNTGDMFMDNTLNEEAAKHQSTKNFMRDIAVSFQKEINENGFKDDGSFQLDISGKPHFDRAPSLSDLDGGDMLGGLKIAVNDVWTYSIRLVDYKEVNGRYTANIKLVLYDHYGLDTPDLTQGNGGYRTNFAAGFMAWYILQHGRGYKPFIVRMDIPTFTITGTTNK